MKVTDACQSLIGFFSTLPRCVVFGRLLQDNKNLKLNTTYVIEVKILLKKGISSRGDIAWTKLFTGKTN